MKFFDFRAVTGLRDTVKALIAIRVRLDWWVSWP